MIRVTAYVSSRIIVRRTLDDLYSPYFLPEVIVKFMRRVTEHFVDCLLKVTCIKLSAFLDISPLLEFHKATESITTSFLGRSVHNRGITNNITTTNF